MSRSMSGRSVATVALFTLLASSPALGAPAEPDVRTRIAALRVPFVANAGQVDAQVAYHASTFAGTVFVTRQGEVVYALRGPSPSRADHARRKRVATPAPGWSLTETLVGGRPQPTAGPTAGARVSFFLGADPSRHRSALPTHASVGLGEVWPGVTVALHAAGASVEKYFTVKPGASPDPIRVRVDGATALRLTPQGALVAETGLGDVTFTAPIAYQETAGRRRTVEVAYRLNGNEYGFALGAYDRARPLVIDPLLQTTYIGGSGDEFVAALAIHPTTGDIYVAGQTDSTPFPGTAGGAQTTNNGNTDAFVARFNSALTTLLQSTFLGGSQRDVAHALAIHPTTGDVYVAGQTGSNPFPGTAGGAQAVYGGSLSDAFVTRFNSALTTLIQSTYLGGAGGESGQALAIHPTTGEVYLAGNTSSPTLPGIAGGAQTANGGGITDAFVARFNSALTTLSQSTFLGGTGRDEANALAIHPTTGNVYVAGATESTTFPGTAGGAQTTNGGSSDVFVTRFNSALTTLSQSTFLGGTDADLADALAIHPTTGDVYVAGSTSSTPFPGTAGGAQATFGGGFSDAFVSRLNSALTTLIQSTFLGGSVFLDDAFALAIHPATGDVYVAGETSSGQTDPTPFPGTTGGAQASIGGATDGYVARLNSALTTLIQSTFLGGSNSEFINALAIHPTTGHIYVAGETGSTNFPGTTGGAQTIHGGGILDGFVSRLTADLRGPQDLTVSKTHAGNFTQGQAGTYTITVSNIGFNPTSGTVTVTDTVPAGLTATAIGGTGWTCTQPSGPCTRGDALASGASYPALTLTVNVAGNAPGTVTNSAAVSGGGEVNPTNNTANDPTTITPAGGGGVPDLTIAKTHAGNFTQGQTGATYTITVTNGGTGPTSGTVTVTENVPTGLTAIAISGTGWACTQPSGPCTRSDALAAGASYPPITLTVNVASNAPSNVINSATVAGGGQVNTTNDGQTDPTIILPPGAVVPIPVMSQYGWALMVALLLVTAMATLRRRRGPSAGGGP